MPIKIRRSINCFSKHIRIFCKLIFCIACWPNFFIHLFLPTILLIERLCTRCKLIFCIALQPNFFVQLFPKTILPTKYLRMNCIRTFLRSTVSPDSADKTSSYYSWKLSFCIVCGLNFLAKLFLTTVFTDKTSSLQIDIWNCMLTELLHSSVSLNYFFPKKRLNPYRLLWYLHRMPT